MQRERLPIGTASSRYRSPWQITCPVANVSLTRCKPCSGVCAQGCGAGLLAALHDSLSLVVGSGSGRAGHAASYALAGPRAGALASVEIQAVACAYQALACSARLATVRELPGEQDSPTKGGDSDAIADNAARTSMASDDEEGPCVEAALLPHAGALRWQQVRQQRVAGDKLRVSILEPDHSRMCFAEVMPAELLRCKFTLTPASSDKTRSRCLAAARAWRRPLRSPRPAPLLSFIRCPRRRTRRPAALRSALAASRAVLVRLKATCSQAPTRPR